MELNVTMKMDEKDVKEACAQWAAARMPQIAGYRVEVDRYSYIKAVEITIVKIEEQLDASVDP